jgi:hypothetical protein
MRFLFVVLLVGCATTPKTPVARAVTCELDIELLSAPYSGHASSPNDARKTLNDARFAACEALRVDSPTTDCDDPFQVIESTRANFDSLNGVITPSAEVTLRRIVNLLHERVEGEATSPLELCREATKKFCTARADGLSCHQIGVECHDVDASTTRCAPSERERVRPKFGPR